MTEFIEFAKTYGLPMALVVVFIYWSWKRENQLPVEAVGARALRNRQRVSLTEVGL